MSQGEIFIFSCLNFGLLIAGLVWGLRRVARQFFYARREELKKQMIAAAHGRRDARARLSRCRKMASGLEAEIAERRKVMSSTVAKECEAIMADARRRADGLRAGVMRQIREDESRAQGEVRASILERAFERAAKILRDETTAAARGHALDSGIADLTDAMSGKGAAASGGDL